MHRHNPPIRLSSEFRGLAFGSSARAPLEQRDHYGQTPVALAIRTPSARVLLQRTSSFHFLLSADFGASWFERYCCSQPTRLPHLESPAGPAVKRLCIFFSYQGPLNAALLFREPSSTCLRLVLPRHLCGRMLKSLPMSTTKSCMWIPGHTQTPSVQPVRPYLFTATFHSSCKAGSSSEQGSTTAAIPGLLRRDLTKFKAITVLISSLRDAKRTI